MVITMKKFAFIWPTLVLLLAPALLLGMVAHTYRTSSLPYVSLYNMDGAFDQIEVKGSLRNDTYGYQMDFQVRSGEESAVSRFYYRAPADNPFTGDKPEGFEGMSWQIWIPQDAQSELISSDKPDRASLEAARALSDSQVSESNRWISYMEEWESDVVEAQLYFQNASGISKALGLPVRLQGEGSKKLKVICEGFIMQTAYKEWVEQDARPTAVHSQEEMLMSNSVSVTCWQKTDGYLYYINSGEKQLLPFSGLYRVKLSDFLGEEKYLYPEELIPPTEMESRTFLKLAILRNTPVLVTSQNGTVSIRTGSLSEKRWFVPLLIETYYPDWNPVVDICASGPAVCVRLIASIPGSGERSSVWYRAVSAEDGKLLAWGNSTISNYEYWPEIVTFDALFRNGTLYTLDFLQYTSGKQSDFDRSLQPIFSAMNAAGPLLGKKQQELMGLHLLNGLPPMNREICSRIAISFVQEAES